MLTFRLCTFTCVLLLVFAFSSSVYAEETGEQMLALCTGDKTERAVCVLYIDGFIDGMLMQAMKMEQSPAACLPEEGVSKEQLRRIFVKFIEDHPKMLNYPKRVLLLLTLIDAYPCKK